MKPSWVAATVRARLVATHGVGRERALAVARESSLADGIAALASTIYGKATRPDAELADAQHAVAATALWQLRVLAGWLPPGAALRARVLVAWFEIANVDERLAELAGMPSRRQFDLGSLGSASRRIAAANSPRTSGQRSRPPNGGIPGATSPSRSRAPCG